MSNQPVKNQQYIFYITLVSRSTGQWQVNPTIAAGDFKVSTDGGAYNNLGTLPSVDPAGSRSVKVTLSSSEMNGSNVNFQGVDAAGNEWDDVFANFQPLSWLNTDDVVVANITQIDGQATNGNNATLKLKQLNVTNTNGVAIVVRSTNTDAFTIDAAGAGISINSISNGIEILASNSAADAVYLEGGTGVEVYGDAGNGVSIYSYGTGLAGIEIDNFSGGKSINAPQGIIGSDAEDLSVTNITDKIWDEQTSGHTITGSTGKALTDAGNAGDPWGTALPGAYTPGQAGHILASRMPTGTVIVSQNNDKTGYSLSSPQVFDLIGNVSGTMTNVINVVNPVVAGVVTGSVLGNVDGSVGSVINPVGIATGTFLDAMADKVWSYVNRTLTAFGFGVTVTTNNDKTDYVLTAAYDPAKTAAQAGDAMTLTVAYDAAKTAAQVSDIPTTAQNADAVWDEAIAGHLTAGSTGNALNAAGSAGDPWSTILPGAYGAGTAGDIVGNRLDIPISDVPTANENADALLKRDWTAIAGEASRSVLNALRKLRNKVSFDGVNTLTVTKEDDATPAYTQGVVEDANQDPFKEVG